MYCIYDKGIGVCAEVGLDMVNIGNINGFLLSKLHV